MKIPDSRPYLRKKCISGSACSGRLRVPAGCWRSQNRVFQTVMFVRGDGRNHPQAAPKGFSREAGVEIDPEPPKISFTRIGNVTSELRSDMKTERDLQQQHSDIISPSKYHTNTFFPYYFALWGRLHSLQNGFLVPIATCR